jgi:hypothetical protein
MPVYSRTQYIEAIVWDPKLKYEELPDWVRKGHFRIDGDLFIYQPYNSCREFKLHPGDYILRHRVGESFGTLNKKMFERMYSPTKYQSLDQFVTKDIFNDNDWKEPVVDIADLV